MVTRLLIPFIHWQVPNLYFHFKCLNSRLLSAADFWTPALGFLLSSPIECVQTGILDLHSLVHPVFSTLVNDYYIFQVLRLKNLIVPYLRFLLLYIQIYQQIYLKYI